MELRGLIFGWLVTTDNALIGLIDETERDACTMVFFPFFFLQYKSASGQHSVS